MDAAIRIVDGTSIEIVILLAQGRSYSNMISFPSKVHRSLLDLHPFNSELGPHAVGAGAIQSSVQFLLIGTAIPLICLGTHLEFKYWFWEGGVTFFPADHRAIKKFITSIQKESDRDDPSEEAVCPQDDAGQAKDPSSHILPDPGNVKFEAIEHDYPSSAAAACLSAASCSCHRHV
jgi:hypothetical protein